MVKVTDIVPGYDTSADGKHLYAYLRSALAGGKVITLSFAGVDGVPSSFVNASLVQLVEDLGKERVQRSVKIVDCTAQVADMLRRCLNSAGRPRAAA